MIPNESEVFHWLEMGKKSKQKYSYMLVMLDLYSNEYYPFYVKSGSEHREELYSSNVWGVYKIDVDAPTLHGL